MKIEPAPLRCPCGGVHFALAFTYTEPAAGEIRFRFSEGSEYRREVLRCGLCGHFVSRHQMEVGNLYDGEYVSANYADADGIRRTFERISQLPEASSDNVGRVRRLLDFADRHLVAAGRRRSILDVGSGLCVFLHRMKAAGWDCTALDPDPRAVRHAQETVGIPAICGDFLQVRDLGRFDVVAFNKVLEHVEDPVGMLAKATENVAAGGFVYLEVPDGGAAVGDGKGREEFFIDHLHIFCQASVALMAERAGFQVHDLEALREPSTKYTLRAFLAPQVRRDCGQS